MQPPPQHNVPPPDRAYIIAALTLIWITSTAADPVAIEDRNSGEFLYDKEGRSVVIEYVVHSKMLRSESPSARLTIYGDGFVELRRYDEPDVRTTVIKDAEILRILGQLDDSGLLKAQEISIERELSAFRRNHSDRGAIADGATVEIRISLNSYRPNSSRDAIQNYHRVISADNPLLYAEKYPEIESLKEFSLCVVELHAIFLDMVSRKEGQNEN